MLFSYIFGYRDFRESTGPNYEYTSLHWHIIAARLAFMIVFENLIYFFVYLIQSIIPDVSSKTQEGIDRQRYYQNSAKDAAKKPSDAEVEFKNKLYSLKRKIPDNS